MVSLASGRGLAPICLIGARCGPSRGGLVICHPRRAWAWRGGVGGGGVGGSSGGGSGGGSGSPPISRKQPPGANEAPPLSFGAEWARPRCARSGRPIRDLAACRRKYLRLIRLNSHLFISRGPRGEGPGSAREQPQDGRVYLRLPIVVGRPAGRLKCERGPRRPPGRPSIQFGPRPRTDMIARNLNISPATSARRPQGGHSDQLNKARANRTKREREREIIRLQSGASSGDKAAGPNGPNGSTCFATSDHLSLLAAGAWRVFRARATKRARSRDAKVAEVSPGRRRKRTGARASPPPSQTAGAPSAGRAFNC